MAQGFPQTKADWRPLYHKQRWRNPKYGLRWQCLVRDGMQCQVCKRVECSARLNAHHLIPHKGDPVLFWNLDNLATLCVDCHELVTIEQEQPGKRLRAYELERRGYADTIDADGYPIDPRHPFNEIRPD